MKGAPSCKGCPKACCYLQVTPDWERLTKHIEDDKETKDKLGWVREMYAWSIGAALQARLMQIYPASCVLLLTSGSTSHR
jgi:hypothetical protein